MFMSMMFLALSALIVFFLVLILNMISKKTFFDKEKNSPFECGFDPNNNSRMPFSIQFFLIAMIFLIFDVEIALILPTIKIIEISKMLSLSVTLNFFFIILILGIYHEWNQGALTWLK